MLKPIAYLCMGLSLLAVDTQAQKKNLEHKLEKSYVEGHLRFLASDELQGRRTGEQGNHVAARYIAEQFRKLGVTPAPGQNDYFQEVPFEKTGYAKATQLIVGTDTLRKKGEIITLSGLPLNETAEIVYAAYGQEADFKNIDVKGKVVLTQSGTEQSQTPREHLAAANAKRKLAKEKGAIALIELYTGTTPFDIISNSLGGERLALVDEKSPAPITLPHIWVNGKEAKITRALRDAWRVSIDSKGRLVEKVMSRNVVGYIEGSDAKLKDQYLMLSAHYDHVGVGRQGGQPYTAADSIFNGARDNAFGVSAILTAADMLSKQKIKRSVLIIAFTGEELGLLGSRYYANNPVMPLNKCIFNMNNDGAGYNDTSLITVFGYKRTGASDVIAKAAKAYGLEVVGDPSPEQNLFDRSDNVQFAIKGIPAPTFSPGFREFDAEIMKYYHQAGDNPDTIDFDYLLRYTKAYIYACRLVGNATNPPRWESGDKYEPAAKALYGY